ncbi:MAG: TonB-dependent receptor [Planctomycetes bacterium]|nr:TonB-dependent receptor [Planctomycetota bacterium]
MGPSPRSPGVAVTTLSVAVLALLPASSWAQSQAPSPPGDAGAAAGTLGEGDGGGLLDRTLEELLDTEVSVASRHGEPLRDVPAAVYVITGDEIRRAGHTSIQEALRMVPGFHVAQWKSSGWDVTARGFTGSLSSINESFANQLLLIIDGVSVYSPAMAGIWWPLYDIPIEDIDRIEIIRGPAGTLWGTNAMNGVVHVITKHPRQTTGSMATTTLGIAEQRGGLREGGPLGSNGWYRSYVSYGRHAGLPDTDGRDYPEDWKIGSAGVRADWDLEGGGRTTVMTHLWSSEFGEDPVDTAILGLPAYDDTPKNGGYLLASWEFGPPDDVQKIQGWYSSDYQKQLNLQMDVQVGDLEYTRHMQLSDAHQLTLGVGYRSAQTNLQSERGFNDFSPEFRRSNSVRIFAQDEFGVAALDSRVILGVQLEEADLGGLTLQPTLRWMWNATEHTALWAGISRAVRTPSREEVDNLGYNDPNQPPVFTGNKDFKNEAVLAHEIGLRTNLGERVQVDLTAFYNDYDDLQTFEFDNLGLTTYGNEASATAHGAEMALDLELSETWRVRTAYTYFEMDFETSSNAAGAPIDAKDGLVPRQNASVRSYYNLGEHWELDTALYWSDYLRFWDNPAVFRVDARVGWKPNAHTVLSIGVQNAQEEQHPEAGEDIDFFGSEVRRNAYLSLRISY